MAEILFSSPIGILSIITVGGAIAVIVGWLIIWMVKLNKSNK
jgi:hypothetical protein